MTVHLPPPRAAMEFQDEELLQAVVDALDGVAYLATAGGDVVLASTLHAEPDMPAAPLVGSNLFAVILGDEVRDAYRRLHDRALADPSAVVAFEFRCDAPQVKRCMRMSVRAFRSPRHEPLVLYQSLILSAVHRPWISLFEAERLLEQVRAEGGLPIVRLCSFCQRVDGGAASTRGPWLEAEDYYRSGGASDVRTSHGVCPECSDRLDLG